MIQGKKKGVYGMYAWMNEWMNGILSLLLMMLKKAPTPTPFPKGHLILQASCTYKSPLVGGRWLLLLLPLLDTKQPGRPTWQGCLARMNLGNKVASMVFSQKKKCWFWRKGKRRKLINDKWVCRLFLLCYNNETDGFRGSFIFHPDVL